MSAPGPVWDVDDYGEQDRARGCEGCGFVDASDCTCVPCDGCAKVMDGGNLTWAADGRWRCPKCHLNAELKLICRERPSFAGAF